MRTRYYGIVLLTFILTTALAIGGNSSPVSAYSCTAQLGYSSFSSAQYNSNIVMTVPVSATCFFVTGAPLYAVGTAYDTSSNGNLGSVSTALTAASGNTFTGQFVFNLSSSIVGRQVQVSASIYSGYAGNGAPLATAVQLQRVNLYNYQNGYNYHNGYNCYSNPYCNYPSYYSYYNYAGSYNGNYYTTCQPAGSNTVRCSGYVYQPANGCVVLAIPIENGYWFESQAYQYYTLHNLPSSYSTNWRWATVTGQLYQGYNTSPYGASCPGNYIVVSAVTP
jgi:hypothetical protein